MNDNQQTTTTQDSPTHSGNKVTASHIIAKYQQSSLEDIMHETPAVISAEIVLLSAKLHEAGSLTLDAEKSHADKWAQIRAECDTDGQADKKIKGTDEYRALQKCKINEKIVLEVIRALKKLLQSKQDEARNIY